MKIKISYIPLLLGVLFTLNSSAQQTVSKTPWTEKTNINKPWTRWWWMGSAVDEKNLKQNLIDLHNVGIGGVEIAPIYGVKGEEDNFIDYLSPKWMKMLDYTVKIADSLDMQVDLTLGTGWPYGGPQVTPQYAATKLVTEKYEVKKGDVFNQEIIVTNEKDKKNTTLQYVLAYGDNGDFIDLTCELKNNSLKWKAKKDNYTIYAVFEGKTGQKVKRAAPGGSGFTLDHYSVDALKTYVKPFDDALVGFDGKIRSIFNDSYEVYGTDYTAKFFETFEKNRGYDLKPHLPLLLDKNDTEEGKRVKSDYRETISDLLKNFDNHWTAWGNNKGFKSKLQAHGSPGNLLDLYASADIPECETFGSMPYDIPGLRREKEDIRDGDADPVMLKFSSSAGHVSGKPLISSETFTWLRDHFKTAISQCKPEVEDLLLNGINHVFLHGTTYSPKRAAWPGWKFYASVNFNPNLTIGEEEAQLFSYIANCQSLLQSGTPDNENLLYWPIYDTWGKNLDGTLFFEFKIHSLKKWLHGTSFYDTTRKLMDKGYGMDFISDNFIQQATFKNGMIHLPGGSYKTLIIPACTNMPLATLEKLIDLKKQGAKVIFEGLPSSVPGFNNYQKQNKRLQKLLAKNKSIIYSTNDVFADLNEANVQPEKLVETGLKFIRRDDHGNKIYYLVNHTAKAVDQYIPININNKEVIIFNPNTSDYGKAQTKKQGNITLVKVQIKPGESLFLKTENSSDIKNWLYFKSTDKTYKIKGNWEISFLRGGPSIPKTETISELTSWTTLSKKAEGFSGTAKYQITIQNPDEKALNWLLKLGDVRESAKIWVNGKYVGALWSNPFEMNIGALKKGENIITLEVTNLSANRIRAKEMRGEEWKNFYEINMVDKDYNKFDATKWKPMPSGLLGPITLTPLTKN